MLNGLSFADLQCRVAISFNSNHWLQLNELTREHDSKIIQKWLENLENTNKPCYHCCASRSRRISRSSLIACGIGRCSRRTQTGSDRSCAGSWKATRTDSPDRYRSPAPSCRMPAVWWAPWIPGRWRCDCGIWFLRTFEWILKRLIGLISLGVWMFGWSFESLSGNLTRKFTEKFDSNIGWKFNKLEEKFD